MTRQERNAYVLLVLAGAQDSGKYMTVPEIVKEVNALLKRDGRKTYWLRRDFTMGPDTVRHVLEDFRQKGLMVRRFRPDPTGDVTILTGSTSQRVRREWLLRSTKSP